MGTDADRDPEPEPALPRPSLPRLAIDAEIAPHLRAGIVALDRLHVEPSGPPIEAAFAALEERLAGELAGRPLLEQPVVGEVRRLFHRLHIDPTKVRPSSEALLRRMLKGKGLFRISNAVDVCNLCSIETRLPIGLYDLAAIAGDVRLRLGAPGEGYDGIRKDRVNVEGRPTLVDARGPFGAPTSDSFRTRVHDGTRSLYLIVFVPAALGIEHAARAVETIAGRTRELCRARILEARVHEPPA